MKQIQYFVEGIALHLIFFIFWIFPANTASAIGGWLGRMIGPKMGASRTALKHLKIAFPDMDEKTQKETIIQMWDNLGRVIAEYPHIKKISRDNTYIEGLEELKPLFKKGGPAIFFGAHIANWEITAPALLTQFDEYVDVTYRAPNNPWANKLLGKSRTLGHKIKAYSKSKAGGRQMMAALKQGRFIGFLIDQKYNEGVASNFFGAPAMTNPVFIKLCQKYKCPLIPYHGERVAGPSFKITFHEPLEIFDASGKPLPVEDVLKKAHLLLEGWIKDNPSQWLWLHKRWNSKDLKDL